MKPQAAFPRVKGDRLRREDRPEGRPARRDPKLRPADEEAEELGLRR